MSATTWKQSLPQCFYKQIGALKAGVTLVYPVNEKFSNVSNALKHCQPDILLVSPFAPSYEGNNQRIDSLKTVIPELNNDTNSILRTSAFPNLKQIIQISHKTIPKTNKFKHTLNYSGLLTTLKQPTLLPSDVAVQIHFTADEHEQLTHANLLENAHAISEGLNIKNSNVINTTSTANAASLTLFLAMLESANYSAFPSSFQFDLQEIILKQNAQTIALEEELAKNILSADNTKLRETSDMITNAALFVPETNHSLAGDLHKAFPNLERVHQINSFTGASLI